MPLSALTQRKSKPRRKRPVVEGMEPRILYSADGLSALVDPLHADSAGLDTPPVIVPDAGDHHAVPPVPEAAPEPAPTPTIATELVVIDSRVTDYQKLVDDIQARSTTDAWFEIIVLNQIDSGISQITELLAQRQDVSAVHILSHGQNGGVEIGVGLIDGQALQQQAASLALWKAALTENADVLIYGCDVAEGSSGQAFIQELARLTGADVAASGNVTGSAGLGGDWVLEAHVGFIDTPVLLSGMAQAGWSGTLATYTVSNLNDSGANSLRDAIAQSNASTTIDDTILFSVSGTINVGSTLTINDTVSIDASSGGVPSIVLDGNNVAADGIVVTNTAGGSILRGFVIRDFSGDAIEIQSGSNGNTIAGNYIGRMTLSGADAGAGEANVGAGINVNSVSNITIGGTSAADRNVIAGNQFLGIGLYSVINARVIGNYIGVAADGTTALGNGDEGIYAQNGTGLTIGGDTTAEGNVISASGKSGIYLFNETSAVIQGNYVGTDISGTLDLGNNTTNNSARGGIRLESMSGAVVGGPLSGEGNLIAHNTGQGLDLVGGGSHQVQGNVIDANTKAGVYIDTTSANNLIGGTAGGAGNTITSNGWDGIRLNGSGVGNSFLGNVIYGNTEQGIDIGTNGVTLNDTGDGDTGGNSLQNFPVINSAITSGSSTTLTGTLNSTPNTTFRIEFFSSEYSQADTIKYGEAARYLGSTPVTTDATGNASFSANLANVTLKGGEIVTATATDASGNTSEFAGNVLANQEDLVVTGNYTGDGVDNRTITGLGFRPELVIVFDGNGQIAAMRSSSMNGDASKPMTGSTGLTANLIQSLDVNGFTLGNSAQVNGSTRTYDWVAFGAGSDIYVGSYSGNGTSQTITGIPFQPEMVLFMPSSTAVARFDSSLTVGNTWSFDAAAGGANGVTAYNANGFAVGSGASVNASGATIYYVAFNQQANYFQQGTYTGNNSAQDVTSVGFEPEFMFVRQTSGTRIVPFRLEDTGYTSTNTTLYADTTGPSGGSIQNLLTNGFHVGNSSDVNASATTYGYFAFRERDPLAAVIAPTSYTAIEQTGLALHGTGLSLVDSAFVSGDFFKVTLSVGEGVLNVAAGTTGATVTNTGTATVTISGTQTQINNLLAGLSGGTVSYTDNLDAPSASTTLTMTAENTAHVLGGSGPVVASDTVTIGITAVSDAPVATADSYSVNEDSTLAVNWWDADWTRRSTITLSGNTFPGATSLTDFPVLITLNSSNIDYSLTQNSGQDLRFFEADGTPLAYEIDKWNEAGVSTVWVRVPQVDTTGTDRIFMYYGNAAAIAGQTPSAVWNANYSAVYHFGNSGTAVTDSTTNALSGTATNGPVSSAAQVGDGLQFDGVNDYVNLGTNQSIINNAGSVTYSTWVNPASVTGAQALISTSINNGGVSTALSRFALEQLDANVQVIIRSDDATTMNVVTTTNPLAIGSWKYISVTVDLVTDAVAVYVDGVLQATTATGSLPGTAFPSTNSAVVALAANDDGAGTFLNGRMDEVRIAKVAQSAAWVKAEYLNVSNSFVTVGAAVAAPATAGVLGNDSDADSTRVSAVLVSGPAHASSFSLNADGTFTYAPMADYSGSDAFTYHANDGSLNSADVTVSITVNPVNDAPVLGFVGTMGLPATDENTPSSGTPVSDILITGLFSDVDPTPSRGIAVVSVIGNGTFEYSTDGLAWTGFGAVSANNALLLGSTTQVRYVPDGLNGEIPNFIVRGWDRSADLASVNGTPSYADPAGGGGSSPYSSQTATVQIFVVAVNDAPTATVTPLTYAATEQTALILHGTGLSIADVDAGTSAVRATLTVNNGLLTAATGTTGVTVTGSGTATMLLDGTLTQINNLLAGNLSGTLTYAAMGDVPAASDTLTLTASDLGNTGTGGTLTGNDTATINITAVNDAPTATITPLTYAATEQVALTLHGTGLSIADVDAGGAAVRATVSVVSGIVNAVAGTTGVIISGSGTAMVTIDGTLNQINNLLAGNLSGTLTYTANSDTPAASDTLTLTASDLGNTGTGGTLTGNDTATINITAVNDAPTATITPLTYAATEQVALMLHGTGLSIADVDAGGVAVRATVSVVSGVINAAAGTTGVTVSGSGTNTVTLDGTLVQINNLLAGNLSGTLTYTAASDTPAASDTLTLTASDLGNTGSGGTLTGNDTATINITAVNDAPVNLVPIYHNSAGGALVFDGVNDFVAVGAPASLSMTNTMTVEAWVNPAAVPATDYIIVNKEGEYEVGILSDGTLAWAFANASPGWTWVSTGYVAPTNQWTHVGVVYNAGTITTYANGVQVHTFSGSGVIGDVYPALNDFNIGTRQNSATQVFSGLIDDVRVWNVARTSVEVSSNFDQTLAGNETGLVGYWKFDEASGALAVDSSLLGNTGTLGGGVVASQPARVGFTVNEDSVLTFSQVNGNAIAITDVDAGAGALQITLTGTNGTVSLSGTTGLAFTTGDGTADATMTFTGTLANINTALNNLTFAPTPDFNGLANLRIVTSDLGNTGAGGALSDIDDVSITVNPINDAPVNTVPGAQTVNEDTALAVGGLSISEVDAGGASITSQLTVSNGALNVNLSGGASISAGANGSNSLTLSGTQVQISAALATVSYQGNPNFNGSDTLQIVTSDLGNSGAGGTLADTDSVAITVTAANDAPTVTITPASYAATEQVALTMHGTGLSIADVDAGGAAVRATVSVVSGVINAAAGTTGVTVSGNGSSTVTLDGTLAQINNLLAGNFSSTLTYTANSDTPAASDTLTLTASDLGNTGTGGTLTGNDTATINITAVNDAPTATITPLAYAVNEQVALTLHGTGLSIADIDAGSATVRATVSVVSGIINAAAGTTGVSISGNGTNAITLDGTLTQINNLLAGNLSSTLTYTANSDTPAASDTLTLAASDLGNTGTGGTLTGSDTATINITAVNDAPVNTVPGPQIANEDIPLAIAGLSINDADVGVAGIVTQLTVTNGVLNVSLAGGATVSAGANGSSTLTLSGTRVQINAALATLSYQGNLNFNGPDTLQIITNDMGGSGTGGALSDTDTVAITVNAVNDAPSVLVPGSQTITAGSDLTLSGATAITVADIDATAVEVTLSVTNGGLTLGSITGLTFSTGNGSDDAVMVFAGTLANVNAALNGLLFKHGINPPASATINVSVTDNGSSGSGGPLTDVDAIVVTINPVGGSPIPGDAFIRGNYLEVGLGADGALGSDFAAPGGYASAGTQLAVEADRDRDGWAVYDGDFILPGSPEEGWGVTVGGITYTNNNTVAQQIAGSLGNLQTSGTAQSVDWAGAVAGVNVLTTYTVGVNDLFIDVQVRLTNSTAGTLNNLYYYRNVDPDNNFYTNGLYDTTNTIVSQGNDGGGVSLVSATQADGSYVALMAFGDNSRVTWGGFANRDATAIYNGTGLNQAGSGTVDQAISLAFQVASLAAGDSTVMQYRYYFSDRAAPAIDLDANNSSGATGANFATAYVEGAAPVRVADTDAALVDIDSANLTGLTVTIANRQDGIAEILAANTTGTGITATFNAGAGVLTLSGSDTVDHYRQVLRTITYQNISENPDNTLRQINFTATDGTLVSNTASAFVSVSSVNDAPVNTVPGSVAGNEDTPIAIGGLGIADVDGSFATTQLTVTDGTLNVSLTGGATISAGSNGGSTLTLSGTQVQINAALATVSYQANLNFNGVDSLQIVTSDLGNSGAGGILTDTDSVAISVSAVNDAPTATITPLTYAATEQVALTLHGTGLAIADVDAGGAAVRATVSVVSGIINAAAGTTGVTIGGSGANTVTLDGTLAQINNLLAGNLSGTLTYTANSDTPVASDTLTLTASDLGNTGTGGTLTGNDTATINITAVNDAPTATITPLTYAATEQVALTLHGTGLAIADVDAAAAAVRATVSVASGILNAAVGTTGVTISGNGTNTVTLDGTLAQINNLLAGSLSGTLTYTANSDTPAASDTLTLTASDLGNTGTGGTLTGNDTATIDITAVNDAPTATITPLTYAATEQTALTLHGTGLAIADVDAGAAAVRATVSVVSGIINAAAGTTGVTISGNGTNSVTLDGTLTQINNLLAGNLSGTLTYTANSDTPVASDTLTLTASDLGNTGTGGTLTGNDTATINITAVNDAPTAIITPLTYAATEQVALTLHGTGLAIADVDAGVASVRATVSVVSGIINAAAGTTGVTISGTGTNTVTLDGTLTQINNLLAGSLSGTLTYTANSDTPAASDTLTLTASDLGNTGTGGTLTGNDTATINLTAVNDAPTATITPLTYVATEQVALTLHGTGLSIADVDAGGAAVRTTVSVASGILSVAAGTTGVTVSGNGTNAVTLDGTLIQINNLLAGNLSGTLTYTANSDTPVASDTLTLTASDLGNTGAGGTLTGNDTAIINITAVNDAPTATITPASYAATEQVALTLHGTGLSIADVDAGAAAVRATVSVVSGVITAAVGTTGVTISGSGTNTVTLDGTLTQINNLLAGNLSGILTYTANSDTPAASDNLTLTASDLGNTGTGGTLTGNDTATINITAVNDAPTATITPLTYAATEQVALTLHGTGLSIADVDAGSAVVRATVTVVSGVINAAVGTTGVTISGSGTNTVTLDGTLTQINNLLAGNLSGTLTYTANSDTPVASDTLTLTASDLGNTGTGGTLTGNDTATINITAVNDAPTATITQLTYAATEQVALTLHGTGLSIADVDAGGVAVRATVSVVSGVINAAAGTTGVTVSGSGSATVTLDGTLIQINNFLAGTLGGTLTYTANSDTPAASDTLTLTASDLGNAGTGGTLTGNDTATINITSVNDAPTANITPLTYAATEQVALTLHGTGLSIADVDAGGASVRATVSVVSGIINTVAGTTGVTISGSGTNTVTLDGTLTQINNLLAGNLSGTLTYTANSDTPAASDTLTLTASDLGNTGTGGTLTGNDTAIISIAAVNDAPVNTVPGAQTVNEDTLLSIGGLSIGDVDIGAASATTQLTVGNGTLNVSVAGGAAIISGANGSNTLTLSGTQAQINAALATLSYQGNLNFNGSDSLQVVTNDLGNTGTGGALIDTDIVAISVNAVNDAPVNSVPGAQAVNEDTPLSIAGISINDVDGNFAATQLTVANGTLNVSLAGGAGIIAGASSSNTLTISGTQAQINAALATLSYQGNLNFNGLDTLQIVTNDLGNSGAGGALTVTDTVAIAVNAANDAPVNTVPGAQTGNEDTALPIAGISVNDVDGNLASTQLTVSNGVLNVNLAGGANISAGANGSNTLTLAGTQAQINAALASLSYLGNLNFNGIDTLTVISTDIAGTPLTDSDVVAITLNAVNDAPVNTVPGAQTVNEDTLLAIAGLSIGDVDIGGAGANTQLTVANGTLNVSLAGGASISAGANGSNTLTLSGSQAQINAALATLSYQSNLNFNGSDALQIVSNDLGNTGSGGALSDTDTVSISVIARNDGPFFVLPTGQSTLEDTPKIFSIATGNGIVLDDVDAGSGLLTLILGVSNGTVTLGGTSGLTFVVGDGVADTTVGITGTLADLNAALEGLVFTPNANFTGNGNIAFSLDDNGNTGSPATPLVTVQGMRVVVTPVNDAPVNSVPVAQSTSEDVTLVFSTASGNAITIGDIDAGAAAVEVSLNASNGVLTLAGTAGLTFLSGDGAADGAMTFRGTLASINAALNGLAFSPNADFNGGAGIQIITNDLGNTGGGGVRTDTDNILINVNPVNDAPVTTPVTLTVIAEDSGPRLITQAELLANATDVDGPALAATSLAISSGAGTLVDNGNGTWTYTPALNDDTGVSFSYVVTDGSLSVVGSATLDILSVNDVPVTTPVTLAAIAEDSGARLITQAELLAKATDVDGPALTATGLAISSGAGTLFDNGNGTWTYTPALNDDTGVSFSYTVTDGSLTVAGSALLDILPVNDGPVTTPVTLAAIAEDSGARLITQAELLANATDVDGPALTATSLAISSGAGTLVDTGNGTWTYTPALNDDSAVSFSYTITDGSLTTPGSATMDILPVNDVPVTTPVTLAASAEDSGARLITQAELLGNATDVDGPALTATSLVISSGAGILVDNGNGTWTYTPALNDDTGVSFSYTVTDGIANSPASATLDITPVNDAAIIGGTIIGAVTEAGGNANASVNTPLFVGTLTSADVDNAADTFIAQAATAGSYGTFQLTEGGQWSYTLDNDNVQVEALNNGDTLTDAVTVQSEDGTSQVLTVIINGRNDAAVTFGATSGAVAYASDAAPGTAVFSGVLQAVDKDNPSGEFQAAAFASAYGSFQITSRGAWTYVLDSANPSVLRLAPGTSITDVVTVFTVDGTPQALNIAINATGGLRLGETGTPAGTSGDPGGTTDDGVRKFDNPELTPADNGRSQSRTVLDRLTADSGDLFGTMTADEPVRRGLVVSAQTALLLQGGVGFISKLAMVARQDDFALTLAGYDFGEYTFQIGRFTLLNQGSGRLGSIGDGEVGLSEPGADDSRGRSLFDVATVGRAAGISLTLGIAAWALRSGGLLAAMMSALPAWRQIDLLPILGDPEKRKSALDEAELDGSEAAREERAVERMLGGRSSTGA